MVSAYLEATGQATGFQAMMRSLAIGPPSLEQLAFEYDMGQNDSYARPP
jgi:hypothetical protein